MTSLGIFAFALVVPLLTWLLDSAGVGVGLFTAAAGVLPVVLLMPNARSVLARENALATGVLVGVCLWATALLPGLAWGYGGEVIAQVIKIVAWGSFYYVAYVSAARDGNASRILLFLGLSAIPAAAQVLYGVLSGQLDYNPVQGQLSFETTSINKSMTHVVLAFAALWIASATARGPVFFAALATMSLYVVAIVLANARVAHIGLALTVIAMLVRGRSVAIAVATSIVGFTLAFPAAVENVALRWVALASGQSVGSVADRFLWWQRGWSFTSDVSPLLGVGKSFRNPFLDGTFPFHSIVVQAFVESGYLGLGLMLASALLALFAIAAWSLKARKAGVVAVFRPTHFLTLFALYYGMSLSENTYISGFQNWVFWGSVGAITGAIVADMRLARARDTADVPAQPAWPA